MYVLDQINEHQYTYLYIQSISLLYINPLSFQHHRVRKFPASLHPPTNKNIRLGKLSAPVWPDRGRTVDFRNSKCNFSSTCAPWHPQGMGKKSNNWNCVFFGILKIHRFGLQRFLSEITKVQLMFVCFEGQGISKKGRRLCRKRNDATSTSMVPAKVDKFVLSLCLR